MQFKKLSKGEGAWVEMPLTYLRRLYPPKLSIFVWSSKGLFQFFFTTLSPLLLRTTLICLQRWGSKFSVELTFAQIFLAIVARTGHIACHNCLTYLLWKWELKRVERFPFLHERGNRLLRVNFVFATSLNLTDGLDRDFPVWTSPRGGWGGGVPKTGWGNSGFAPYQLNDSNVQGVPTNRTLLWFEITFAVMRIFSRGLLH